MAMILFRKLLPKDNIMLLNCVEVHSSVGAKPFGQRDRIFILN